MARLSAAGRLSLAAFVLMVCIVDVAWIRLNVAPPRMFDDSEYLIESLRVYETFRHQGLRQFWAEANTFSTSGHPPMPKLFPLPAYLLVGPGTNAALYAYTGMIPVFCLYLFVLARALTSDERKAAAAVAITCLFPLTYGMWRHVMAEFGTAVAVAGSLAHLVLSRGFRRAGHGALLGVFLGWGLLWKITFPLFVTAPLIYTVVAALRREPGQTRALSRNLVLALALAGLLAGPFYFRNAGALLARVGSAVGEAAHLEAWSMGPVWSGRTLARYWLRHLNFGVSIYFFALLAACHMAQRIRRRRSLPRPARWFLGAWLTPPFCFFSFQYMKEIRWMLPAYPAIAILIAAPLVDLLSGIHRRTLAMAVLLLYPAYQHLTWSFDLAPLKRRDLRWGPLVLSVGDLEAASLEWLPVYTYPANRMKWPVEETVGAIARQWENASERPARVCVGGTNPYFNGLVLAYQARLSRAPVSFYSPFDPNTSEADFVVTLRGPERKYGPLDERDPDLQRRLAGSLLPFQEVERIPFAGGKANALIHKRVPGR